MDDKTWKLMHELADEGRLDTGDNKKMDKTREEKARLIAQLGLIGVLQTDKNGQPNVLRVPGSGGKMYQVIIRKRGTLSTECNLDVGAAGFTKCQGNIRTVCYHSLAALVFVAKKSGKTIKICKDRVDAEKLSNLGGKAYEVKSWQGGHSMWIVVEDEK